MAGTVQQAFDARIAQGAITEDAAQRAVLPLLETVRQGLQAASAHHGILSVFAKPAEGPKGLYLWGGVGRGKSMLMDLFYDTVDVPKRRVHFHAFMQEVHAGMHAARQNDVADALRPVAETLAGSVRLLAFDEMQISDITDAMIVGRLFGMLFEAGVVVVSTSNRAPDDLYKDGLNRALFLPFIDMLKQRMVTHELASPVDHRQGRLHGQQVYFTPIDAQARAALGDIWDGLSGGVNEALVLRVKGRDVVLPRFHNGVARAAFWDLCAKPLGAADYLALAQAVRVLILEEVPCLGRYNYNEAKRFVLLIDALYEARVRLLMSAADVPEQLYVEGEGSFEFERTASRLVEMQAAGWGAGVLG
jgi:cell division protein ZapE